MDDDQIILIFIFSSNVNVFESLKAEMMWAKEIWRVYCKRTRTLNRSG